MATDWGGGAGAGLAPLVADLGRIQADRTQQQGRIWGSSLSEIGNLIAQAPQREALAQERQARALELQGLAQDRQMRTLAMQREQAGTEALAKAISNPANQGDPEKIYRETAMVSPDHAQKYLDLATKHSEALQTLAKAKETQRQIIADTFDGADPTDLSGLQARLGLLHSQGVDVAPYAQLFDQVGPEAAIKQITESAPENVKAARARKEKAAEEAAKVQFAPAGSAILKGGDVIGSVPKEPPPPPRPVEVRTMENGKPVTKFLQPDQVTGQTFAAQPPASVIYPKPPATATPAAEIEPGTAEYKVAQDLAAGKLTSQQFRSLTAYNRDSGKKMAIYAKAAELNPEFNQAQFDLGFKMAGNPAIRQRIVAINSLAPVIDRVDALAEQVGNGDIPAFNKLVNTVKFNIGNRPVTNFRQMQILLGDEVGNALGLGSGSDLKTRLGIDLVNPNLSPANFKATMEQLRSVLDARRDTLYKQMGVYGAGVQGIDQAQTAAPPAPAGWKYVPKPGGGWTAVQDGAK